MADATLTNSGSTLSISPTSVTVTRSADVQNNASFTVAYGTTNPPSGSRVRSGALASGLSGSAAGTVWYFQQDGSSSGNVVSLTVVTSGGPDDEED